MPEHATEPPLSRAERAARDALAAHRPNRGVDPLGTHGRRARIALAAAAPILIADAFQAEADIHRVAAEKREDEGLPAGNIRQAQALLEGVAMRVLASDIAGRAAELSEMAATLAADTSRQEP